MAQSTSEEEGTITGWVRDEKNGNPISGAEVYLHFSDNETIIGMDITDSGGMFSFTNVSYGKYEITVELSLDDKFIRIVELKFNKDYRDYKQKIASTGLLDVDEFYKDE